MRACLSPLLLTIISLALTACGSGDPSVSDENSFDISDPPDFQDEGSGLQCKSTRNLEDNQLLVSVQTPTSGPGAQKGSSLSNTTQADLRLVEIGGPRSKPLSSETTDDSLIVTFENGVPRGIDLAIKASVDGRTMRAPVASECGHVFVTPMSEVLIEEVVSDLSTSRINAINSCNQVACTYDLLWQPVADRVHAFEIDVSGGESALRERADFMAFLDHTETLLGQKAASLTSDKNDPIAPSYNTVQYGVSLNAGASGFWATHTLDRGVSRANGTAYTYPHYSIGDIPLPQLGIELSLGTVDIPRKRRSFDSPLDDAFRSYSTQANQLFTPRDAENGGSMMLSSLRPVLQTISHEHPQTIGWAPNPHVYRAGAHRAEGKPPQAMLSSYFHAARGWGLSGSEDSGYERETIREEQAIATIELNLSEWDDASAFRSSSTYRFAGFELKPGQAGSVALANASLGSWNLKGNRGTETQATTWSLHGKPSPSSGGFALNPVRPKETPDEVPEAFRGHLSLNYDAANQERNSATDPIPNAAVSADERWISASSRPASTNSRGGSLFRVAYKPGASDELPSGTPTYRVQGFSISEANSLTQHDHACLQLGTTADFNASSHTTGYDQGSDTLSIAQRDERSESNCPLTEHNDGTFNIDCGSTGLDFNGFAADGGDTLIMITRTDQSIGFLLGFRDDGAAGCSN
ncbi:hypothetical protein ACMDCT_06655 [Halomonadaceae bacterium KBTZ08]